MEEIEREEKDKGRCKCRYLSKGKKKDILPCCLNLYLCMWVFVCDKYMDVLLWENRQTFFLSKFPLGSYLPRRESLIKHLGKNYFFYFSSWMGYQKREAVVVGRFIWKSFLWNQPPSASFAPFLLVKKLSRSWMVFVFESVAWSLRKVSGKNIYYLGTRCRCMRSHAKTFLSLERMACFACNEQTHYCLFPFSVIHESTCLSTLG